LLSGNNILLSDCSDDIYIQGIIKLVQATGQKVICLNDMDTPENQDLLLKASVIGCSTLSFDNLYLMVSKIPRNYSGFITTLDIGPANNQQSDQLITKLPNNTLSFTNTVPSTMMTLSFNNQWVNTVKLEKSRFTYSYNVSIYIILNSIASWNKLLIKSNIIKNTLYEVYGLVFYNANYTP
jgi:hypothetical protein